MNALNKVIVTCLPAVPKSIVRKFANRYIAGENLADAVRVVRDLNSQGILATLDVLGEDIHHREEGTAARDTILGVLDAIQAEKLNSNVSIKLTQIGLKLDRSFCLENVRSIVERAKQYGNFVRIDMEDSTCTDDTLWVYREIRKAYTNCGIVLQAYLRRTEADANALIDAGLMNFRLCKGIYVEPEAIAFKGHDEINRNYMAVLRAMFKRGAYVGVATHDDELVHGAQTLLEDLRIGKDVYEYQMLLGVRPDLRAKVVAAGHRMRIYVPFGKQWYQYSVRRFKENPQVAGHVFKALFRRAHNN